MGEDCGSWFPQQQFDLQSPNLGYVHATLPVGQRSTFVSIPNPGNDIFSRNGSLPVDPFSRPPGSWVAPSNEPCGWFYCLPRFRQAFAPALNSVLEEKPLDVANDNCNGTSAPKVESRCAQKRFLVFDQSGDQTTLILSSRIGAPIQCFSSWAPKPNATGNLNWEVTRTKENEDLQLKPILAQEIDEKSDNDLHSEMHEDTDELNALLYSDDESDCSEDDEVTSTGHSPSTMTAHDKQDRFEDSTEEEVASSDVLSRKRKLFDDIPDTASSVKPIRGATTYEDDDDAESKCSNGTNLASYKMGFDWGNKRTRREKIRETVGILQDIIPGGKDKDSLVVLDSAIQYLKCLKHEAEALGLDEAP